MVGRPMKGRHVMATTMGYADAVELDGSVVDLDNGGVVVGPSGDVELVEPALVRRAARGGPHVNVAVRAPRGTSVSVTVEIL